MNITIYRNSWARGGRQATTLCGANGDQCCVGQAMSQLGWPLVQLKWRAMPWAVAAAHPVEMVKSFDSLGIFCSSAHLPTGPKGQIKRIDINSKLAEEMASVNDDKTIHDADREHRLVLICNRYGHSIEFKDGRAPWLQASL